GGAAGDERVEGADCATGHGNEGEWEDASGKYRSAAVNEAGERRHLQCRTNQNNSQDQDRDGPQLHKGAEIVTRGQQQPYRQRRGGESISNNQQGQGWGTERENVREAGRLR